jgi:hypothetical protein
MEQETELYINKILFTKDGRLIGNAIIIDITDFEGQLLYKIKTDYGNIAVGNLEKLKNSFYFDNPHIPEEFTELMQGTHKYSV